MVATMPTLAPPEPPEQRFVLHGVTWEQYVALREALDDRPGLRMTYLEGVLEFMSPSPLHEYAKTLIARLLEAYADERRIRLLGYGSTTYRKEAKQRGLEPDECYYVGTKKEVPDIALEVVATSGGIDKLAVYAGLGIPEVWFWVNAGFQIYFLGEGSYKPRARSAFLPDLDLRRLAEIVATTPEEEQADAVWRYRDELRAVVK